MKIHVQVFFMDICYNFFWINTYEWNDWILRKA